jgi:hypothetical protein
MESRARGIFRDALALHYIEGLQEMGVSVEQWLQTHGGYFADPQEIYGDGSPDDQPADEGDAVTSANPAKALLDARRLMSFLVAKCGSKHFELQTELMHSGAPYSSEDEFSQIADMAVDWVTDANALGLKPF